MPLFLVKLPFGINVVRYHLFSPQYRVVFNHITSAQDVIKLHSQLLVYSWPCQMFYTGYHLKSIQLLQCTGNIMCSSDTHKSLGKVYTSAVACCLIVLFEYLHNCKQSSYIDHLNNSTLILRVFSIATLKICVYTT